MSNMYCKTCTMNSLRNNIIYQMMRGKSSMNLYLTFSSHHRYFSSNASRPKQWPNLHIQTDKHSVRTFLNRNVNTYYLKNTSGFLLNLYKCPGKYRTLCTDSGTNVLRNELRRRPPWRVLFLGTDEFSLHHLKTLNENRSSTSSRRIIDKLDVVIHKEKCAVQRYSVEQGLTVYHWPLPDLSSQYDVGVIVSFGHLIPASVINMFPWSILNVHPSLLPLWRGASPIIHTVLNGDTISGVSVIDIRPHKFDVGPIVAQEPVSVPTGCSAHHLMHIMADKGASMLMKCLENLSNLKKVEQDSTVKSTYAHKFKQHHANVNWDLESVDDIDRHYRALGDMLNLRSYWKEYNVRLLEMIPPTDFKDTESYLLRKMGDQNVPNGYAVFVKQKGALCIKCRDGWVGFEKICIRKKMTALAFHNGYLRKPENKDVCFTSLPNKLSKYFGRQ